MLLMLRSHANERQTVRACRVWKALTVIKAPLLSRAEAMTTATRVCSGLV
jgi:hypothetical protein